MLDNDIDRCFEYVVIVVCDDRLVIIGCYWWLPTLLKVLARIGCGDSVIARIPKETTVRLTISCIVHIASCGGGFSEHERLCSA